MTPEERDTINQELNQAVLSLIEARRSVRKAASILRWYWLDLSTDYYTGLEQIEKELDEDETAIQRIALSWRDEE